MEELKGILATDLIGSETNNGLDSSTEKKENSKDPSLESRTSHSKDPSLEHHKGGSFETSTGRIGSTIGEVFI